MLKSSVAVLKKILNTRRRDRKDAEGKGRSWRQKLGGQKGKAGGCEMEGGRNRSARQVAGSLDGVAAYAASAASERLFLSSFE